MNNYAHFLASPRGIIVRGDAYSQVFNPAEPGMTSLKGNTTGHSCVVKVANNLYIVAKGRVDFHCKIHSFNNSDGKLTITDLRTNTITTGAPMTPARTFCGCSLIASDTAILVCGGTDLKTCTKYTIGRTTVGLRIESV